MYDSVALACALLIGQIIQRYDDMIEGTVMKESSRRYFT